MADSITLKSVEETIALGKSWGKACRGGEIFTLSGPLGAGKTQLVKGLALGLDCPGDVTSPTFTLIHEYTGGRLPLYHFDLYRLEGDAISRQLGLEEYLAGSGVTVIEWPEKIASLLPPSTRHYELKITSPDQRLIEPKSGF
jgi:tRNA threonylcarbamoyladenosine biosynthesis protein TsaE